MSVLKRITTKFHMLEFDENGCLTAFRGNRGVEERRVRAVPHYNDPHYSIIASRCGYGDDILSYCQEHELAHCVVAEFLQMRPSVVMRALSLPYNQMPDLEDDFTRYDITCEELLAQTLQRFVRANEEPIISDVYWHDMKQRFLEYLE